MKFKLLFVLLTVFVACKQKKYKPRYPKSLLPHTYYVDHIVGDSCKEAKSVYYQEGNIKYEIDCINGKYDGKFTYYFENGKIREQAYYKNGLKTGLSFVYNENGNLICKEFWNKNKLINEHFEYFDNGKIAQYDFLNINNDWVYQKVWDSTGKVLFQTGDPFIEGLVNKKKIKKGDDFTVDIYVAAPPDVITDVKILPNKIVSNPEIRKEKPYLFIVKIETKDIEVGFIEIPYIIITTNKSSKKIINYTDKISFEVVTGK